MYMLNKTMVILYIHVHAEQNNGDLIYTCTCLTKLTTTLATH